ncbi:hypothetical protein, partial [Lactococcus petauri]|uniref:hypothetical protein n=1 Tax=Lactococcus petauri TaxID=1940789 RepID=UPI0021F1CDD7
MFYSNKPTEPTQKKTFQKDERYIDFVKTHKSLKTTINKLIDETEDDTEKARLEGLLKKNVLKYEFVIIPFKELNFLEWATFNATWDNDSQKFIGSTINSPFNYIKSGYKSE